MTPIEQLERFPTYLANNWDNVLEAALAHALIVAIAIAIASILGIGLGIGSYRNPSVRDGILRVTGLFLTIPSLALYALLITLPGMGFGAQPVVIALTMYALMPIVRNTVTGLLGVDAAIVESAQGMGMSRRQVLRRIELPLAWPVIVTGVRVSTLIVIGIAALGSIVNGPGLGDLIFEGLNRYGTPFALPVALSGFVGVIGVGIAFDLAFNLLTRLTTSKGVR